MLCSISGEAPQVPVASSKSGSVFEKRLIEAYIAEHGKDPVSGDDLTTDDLIELKSSRTVRPRPPTLTSIPSLLSVFQNEWDALALETYTLRQQLAQTRQELSTALYQHDAAVRVIGRLMKERDEARDALSKVSIGAGTGGAGGDEMQIDNQGLPEYIVEKVNKMLAELSSTRKKRPVPADWATADSISIYDTTFTSEELYPGCRSLALDKTGELALFGGMDGIAGVYSLTQQKLLTTLKAGDGAIIDVTWFGTRPITASSSGSVRLWNENGSESAKIGSHAGKATALAIHPCGDILGSVGVDKSWVLYDLNAGKAISQVYTESELTTAIFHPDGHLVALGTINGLIHIYHLCETKHGATFTSKTTTAPIQSLHFSENGYWLAATHTGETTINIWDLRKGLHIKSIDTGVRVDSVRFDYTGQFVAATGPSGVVVWCYVKTGKEWKEILRKGVRGVAVEWGNRAGSLVTLSAEGAVTVLETKE